MCLKVWRSGNFQGFRNDHIVVLSLEIILNQYIMRLFVENQNEVKLYLSHVARTRNDLANKVGGTFFTLDGRRYSVRDVNAEPEILNSGIGMFVGVVIRAFFGLIGIILGALIGGAIGNTSETEEANEVIAFNSSYV